VAVIGGDGTLNGAVNAVLTSDEPETPVAFFPAGRGKDAARTIPSYSADVIGREKIDWDRTRLVDVGRAHSAEGLDRYFINASDIGLSAAAAAFSARLPRQIGSGAYVLGAVYGFLVTRATSARMVLDGDRVVELDDLLTIAVCNGRAFGGGIYIAPDASADDGLLDVVAVRNANLLDLLANLPKLKRGTLREHPALTRWQATSVVVESTTLAPIDVDGEIWGAAPVSYSISPSALNWIGPQP
jgi:YegS/Rv2252/BmrU family lipid kinase